MHPDTIRIDIPKAIQCLASTQKPFPMSATDIYRRWTFQIAHLRTRATKLRRRSLPEDTSGFLDNSLNLCDCLLEELAASQLKYEGAQKACNTSAMLWAYLYESMPMACVEVDGSGAIVRANRSAGSLLNTSVKHLQNRLLMYYVEDRQNFSAMLRRLLREQSELLTSLTIRPRERAPVNVDVTAMLQAPIGATTSLWFLVPLRRQAPDGRQNKVARSPGPVEEVAG